MFKKKSSGSIIQSPRVSRRKFVCGAAAGAAAWDSMPDQEPTADMICALIETWDEAVDGISNSGSSEHELRASE